MNIKVRKNCFESEIVIDNKNFLALDKKEKKKFFKTLIDLMDEDITVFNVYDILEKLAKNNIKLKNCKECGDYNSSFELKL